jgi:hypothetical protein
MSSNDLKFKFLDLILVIAYRRISVENEDKNCFDFHSDLDLTLETPRSSSMSD